jgi:hypothetical protein
MNAQFPMPKTASAGVLGVFGSFGSSASLREFWKLGVGRWLEIAKLEVGN